MKICELFISIQGEASYAGLPCTFLRLTGCNLRCSYCDTRYAFEEGSEMRVDEIMAYVRTAGVPLVEVTGGEPLLQGLELLTLVSRLLDAGYTVLIETNGSFSIRDIDRRAVIILDVKTPGSGMEGSNDLSNFPYLKPVDEVKFVICSRDDYVWARDMVGAHALTALCTVLFSPASGMVDARKLSEWIIEDRLRVRLNLQMHKYIFGINERGV